jgi:hypothetical protein
MLRSLFDLALLAAGWVVGFYVGWFIGRENLRRFLLKHLREDS